MKNYAKALVAAAAASIAFAIPIVDDGLRPSEILGIILAALTSGGAVQATGLYTKPKPE